MNRRSLPSLDRVAAKSTVLQAFSRALGLSAAAACLLALALGSPASAIERCAGPTQQDACADAVGSCPAFAPVGMAASDWPVFQHDVEHTGRTSAAGPTCATPSVLWSKKLTGRVQASIFVGPTGPSGQGTVYVPISKNPICALDPTDGNPLWCQTTEIGRDIGIGNGVLGNGEQLYVGTRDNDLWAIALPNPPQPPATVEWRQRICTDGDVATPPIIGSDGLIYMGSDSLSTGTLMAVCPGTTKQLKWCQHPLGGALTNVSPALSPNGSRLYVTVAGSVLISYDAATGQEKWRVTLEKRRNNGRFNYSPVVDPTSGRIYVGFDEGLYAIDTQVGPGGTETPVVQLLYATYGPDRNRIFTPPALDVANNAVYFLGSRGQRAFLYKVDLSGNLKWKRQLSNGTVKNNPPVVDGNGRIYVAMKALMHVVNPTNGADLWTFPTKEIFIANPVVTPGRVYIGTKRGTMIAIGCAP